MAWIRVVDEHEADEELGKVYAEIKGSRGKLSNILSVHSLHPPALKAHMDLYLSIMFGKGDLSREEREMIAVVVSSVDRCPYCIQHHAAALHHYWKDETKLAAFVQDYRSIELSPRVRAMLNYAEKLTQRPHDVAQEDVEGLRAQGLTDSDVLLVNLIVSYFNFVNRIALGLGVACSEDEVIGYKY